MGLMDTIVAAAQDEPSASQDSPLLALPQELLNIIFEYAYLDDRPLLIKIKERWVIGEKAERRMNDADYQPRPFPGPTLTKFLVSKKYFLSAIQAWLGTRLVKERDVFCGSSGNALLRFAKNVDFGSDGPPSWFMLDLFPNLTMVRFGLRHTHFHHLTPRYPWEVLLAREEIESSAAFIDACRIKNITKLNVDGEQDMSAFGDDETKKEIWRANVEKFAELLKPVIMQPSTPLDSPSQQKGSKSFTRSELLEPHIIQPSTLLDSSSQQNGSQSFSRSNLSFEWLVEEVGLLRPKSQALFVSKLFGQKPELLRFYLLIRVGEHRPGLEIPDSAEEFQRLFDNNKEELQSRLDRTKEQLRKLYAVLDEAPVRRGIAEEFAVISSQEPNHSRNSYDSPASQNRDTNREAGDGAGPSVLNPRAVPFMVTRCPA